MVPEPIEDELRKLRDKIAEQRRRAERGDEADADATQVGASVVFTVPDDDSDDSAG